MRRLGTLLLLTLSIALPSYGVGKSQSYFTYDDGGTIVRQGDNGEEIDARINLPVYAGDEVATSRRGRSEIRLSDGNVLGLDRSTDVRFRSLLDSYDGNDPQTVVELRFGHAIVQRTSIGREALRLDTDAASYIAYDEAVYTVEADGRGKDRVTVFDGAVEVRTPARTTRLREGEQATIDSNGVYGLVSDAQDSADDFERWFLKRAERYGHGSSRYLDRSLAYSDYDLGQHGNWIYISNYGWSWRPTVSAGWRPYYYGEWMYGRGGCLTWVSYEPWGWVPYHYGRWAYDPLYGWVWLPGTGYAPAWVYWMYGPGYVGWAPAGWYDCYQPYYNWCYRGNAARASIDYGFGFFGRIRINEVDLRPWTFVAPGQFVSTRVDRAALTTDSVRNRLMRDGGGSATVTNNPARFTRNELKDPATAVANVIRRGTGSGTGTGSAGSPAGATDMTPFFRRDPELSNSVRERITRNAGSGSSSGNSGGGAPTSAPQTPAGVTRGGLAPIGGGSLAPIGSGGLAPIGSGGVAPIDGGRVNRGTGGASGSGGTTTTPDSAGGVRRDGGSSGNDGGSIRRGDGATSRDRDSGSGSVSAPPTWRDRVQRPATSTTPTGDSVDRAPGSATTPAPSTDWRGRGGIDRSGAGSSSSGSGDSAGTPRSADVPPSANPTSSRGSDVPRRVIDSIGGARVYRPSDGGSSASPRSGSSSGSSGRSSGGSSSSSAPPPRASAPPPQPQPRSAPPPPPPPPPQPRSNNNGDGQVHRDHQ